MLRKHIHNWQNFFEKMIEMVEFLNSQYPYDHFILCFGNFLCETHHTFSFVSHWELRAVRADIWTCGFTHLIHLWYFSFYLLLILFQFEFTQVHQRENYFKILLLPPFSNQKEFQFLLLTLKILLFCLFFDIRHNNFIRNIIH